MTYKGIDVSHYQGNIDFNKVKADGIEFVFIKATDDDNYKDTMFETNYRKAMDAGLKVGCYHFGRFASVEDAKKEANYLLSVIKGKVFTYPVVLDLETDKAGLSVKELTDSAIAFLEVLEANGYFAMLYSGKSFYETELDEVRLKPYATWIARYGSQLGRDAGIWQYSSTGKVAGISGNVDMDIAYYDYSFTSPKGSKVESAKVVASAPKPVSAPKPAPSVATYKVVAGDTLSEIAVKYHTTVANIKALNGLKSDTIYVGQVLKVSGTAPAYISYTVKSGDTLSEIAVKYNTSVAQIKKDNGLSSDLIKIGQVLKIKK